MYLPVLVLYSPSSLNWVLEKISVLPVDGLAAERSYAEKANDDCCSGSETEIAWKTLY